MNDWNELDAFLQPYNFNYINESGVLFHRVAPGFMFVDAPWPGQQTIECICLVYLCNEVTEFFDRLGIQKAEQIAQIKPDLFLQLFYAGEAILICAMRDGNTMEFRRSEGKLFANKENSDLVHEVNRDLKTSKDFIKYTEQYLSKEQPMLKN
jgi:hypothetical protein